MPNSFATAGPGTRLGGYSPTFKLDTRSAVSSRVNWLIWSTMVAILGLVLAAASVDSQRRCVKATEGRRAPRVRRERAQLRAANRQGADMVGGGGEGGVVGAGVRRRSALEARDQCSLEVFWCSFSMSSLAGSPTGWATHFAGPVVAEHDAAAQNVRFPGPRPCLPAHAGADPANCAASVPFRLPPKFRAAAEKRYYR